MSPIPATQAEVPCPECGAALGVDTDAAVGELVECDACGAALEIVALEPLTLSPFDEEEK